MSFTQGYAAAKKRKVSPFQAILGKNFQKEVCKSLMECTYNITKTKTSKDGTPKEISMIKFICPRKHCHKKEVLVEKNQGFTNPFNHLVACYGGEDSLYEAWNEAHQKSIAQGGSLKNYFTAAKVTNVHKDLHRWIRFMLTTNQPLSAVEDPEYRSFSGIKTHFTTARVRNTLLEMTKIVEKKIMQDLHSSGHGAIMHDGWTMGGIHYVGLFACYLRKENQIHEGTAVVVDVPEIVLLSCSPMSRIPIADDTDDSESSNRDDIDAFAMNFTASVHAEHFRMIFHDYYNLDVSTWSKASIADNAMVNRKLSKILNLPHVGCCNHKLNLDIEQWAKEDVRLGRTITSVADTMKQAKMSLKNTAILSELTPLKPIIYNKTRWSGKFDSLSRFVRIRDDLIMAADHEDSNLNVNRSEAFHLQVKKFLKPMDKLNEITKKMQERCCPLSKCRTFLDYIVNKHAEGVMLDQDHVFYESTFQPNRIFWDGPLSPDKHFESGVVKIQRNQVANMTEAERQACSSLLKVNDDDDEIDDNNSVDSLERLENEAVRAGQEQRNSEYINCDFIYGSSAEVERLWSRAKHILTDERKGNMTPLMFETLLYLKVNMRFWDVDDVVTADNMRRAGMEHD